MIKTLLVVMNHFDFNTYLHCHVMEILRRQMERNLPELTKMIFDKTAILDMTVKGVVLVYNLITVHLFIEACSSSWSI